MFKINPQMTEPVEASNLIPKSHFTSADVSESTSAFFEAPDHSVGAGVWECGPCKVDIEAYPVNEMMTIISGALTMIDEQGCEEHFGPGEVVFVAKGAKLTWHITERLRKYYMTSA